MYRNNFVVAVKVNGQILREHKDLVLLPFGAEYSVLVKNLNAVRAKFKVSIDGTDATSGSWVIVPPNADVELERFISNGNWNSGNRFKFIERTDNIEAHRGVKADDGLIRVEYQTEIVRPVIPVPHCEPYVVTYGHPLPWPYNSSPILYRSVSASASKGAGASTGSATTSYASLNQSSQTGTFVNCTSDASEVGVTVPGSVSHQKFVQGDHFETGNSEVIVLHLRGRVGQRAVTAHMTVKTASVCPTCGQKNKRGEFCSGCGTALVI